MLEGEVKLTVLELRLLLGWPVAARDDLGVAEVFGQILTLLARQFQRAVLVVRADAPVLVLLAAGRRLVQVLAAGPPERGNRHLDLPAIEIRAVLHAALAV